MSTHLRKTRQTRSAVEELQVLESVLARLVQSCCDLRKIQLWSSGGQDVAGKGKPETVPTRYCESRGGTKSAIEFGEGLAGSTLIQAERLPAGRCQPGEGRGKGGTHHGLRRRAGRGCTCDESQKVLLVDAQVNVQKNQDLRKENSSIAVPRARKEWNRTCLNRSLRVSAGCAALKNHRHS